MTMTLGETVQSLITKGLIEDVPPTAGDTVSDQMLVSMTMSMKRIADALAGVGDEYGIREILWGIKELAVK